MDTLTGITFGDWCKLLRENRLAVDPAFWGKALTLTHLSLRNTMLSRQEERTYGEKTAAAEIEPPLFIIGHWRTGTTLMHNLLALDERFAHPTLFQVSNPHTFLSLEAKVALLLADLPPHKRPMDNMMVGYDSPGEDEFATAVVSLRSPIIGWSFPRRVQHYDRYLTFRGVPAEDCAEWKDALIMFLGKLTWKHKRPLLLKSPTHTGRLRLLLQMFPNACFVHLHRNPYRVFQSTQRLHEAGIKLSYLQHPVDAQIDADILRRYAAMYDAYLEEKALVGDHQLCDVRFEELEQDMIGQVGRVYEHLGLSGFGDVEPKLRRYVESVSDYKKNRYPSLAEPLRQRIAEAWRRGFEAWGYDA